MDNASLFELRIDEFADLVCRHGCDSVVKNRQHDIVRLRYIGFEQPDRLIQTSADSVPDDSGFMHLLTDHHRQSIGLSAIVFHIAQRRQRAAHRITAAIDMLQAVRALEAVFSTDHTLRLPVIDIFCLQ